MSWFNEYIIKEDRKIVFRSFDVEEIDDYLSSKYGLDGRKFREGGGIRYIQEIGAKVSVDTEVWIGRR